MGCIERRLRAGSERPTSGFKDPCIIGYREYCIIESPEGSRGERTRYANICGRGLERIALTQRAHDRTLSF